MKVELKNVKYFSTMSRETDCFSASVFIDGKKVCTVENDGQGGSHSWSDWSVEKRISAWAAKAFPRFDWNCFDFVEFNVGDDGYESAFERDAEMVINDLMSVWISSRELNRLLKKRILFVRGGHLLQSNQLSKQSMDHVLSNPESGATRLRTSVESILNLMPFDRALELYRSEGKEVSS